MFRWGEANLQRVVPPDVSGPESGFQLETITALETYLKDTGAQFVRTPSGLLILKKQPANGENHLELINRVEHLERAGRDNENKIRFRDLAILHRVAQIEVRDNIIATKNAGIAWRDALIASYINEINELNAWKASVLSAVNGEGRGIQF
jgi:hypothetical protein